MGDGYSWGMMEFCSVVGKGSFIDLIYGQGLRRLSKSTVIATTLETITITIAKSIYETLHYVLRRYVFKQYLLSSRLDLDSIREKRRRERCLRDVSKMIVDYQCY